MARFRTLFVCCLCFKFGVTILSEDEYSQIPKVFEIDNFTKCVEEKNILCRVTLDLKPINTSSNAWKIIQKNGEFDAIVYRKDVINRIRCLPKTLARNEDELRETILNNENDLIKNYSLTAVIKEISCKNLGDEQQPTYFDYAVLLGTIALIVAVLLATVADLLLYKSKEPAAEATMRYVKYFSIKNNWSTVKKVTNDQKTFRMLQGMRVVSTVYVIFGHSWMATGLAYVDNVIYTEKWASITPPINIVGMYIVQVSFLISGWVQTNGIYQIAENGERITLKNIMFVIVYRYLRIFPLLFFLQSWQWSNWFIMVKHLPLEFAEMCRSGCQKYWWHSLFLINNFFKGSDTCNPALWSLAAQFQMFIIGMLLFYLIFNHNTTEKIILYTATIFISLHGYVMYNQGYPYIMAFAVKRVIDTTNSFRLDEYYYMYTSLYANFGSYAIGLMLGCYYYKHKHIIVENNMRNNMMWTSCSLLIPAVIFYLSYDKYTPFWAAIFGPFVKPTISLMLGIGMLGMAYGLGGPIKRLLESDSIQIISKWQYSVYLGHIFVVFYFKMVLVTDLVHSNIIITMLTVIVDVILSYAFGLLLYLFVEKPFAAIVNDIMLPLRSRKRLRKEAKHVK